MYRYTKIVSICGVLVLSSMLCNTEQYMHDAQVHKNETEVMLSLLHLDAMFSKQCIGNEACYRVCQCIKNNDVEDISEQDVQEMVTWMVQPLQGCSAAKGFSSEEQRLHATIAQFFVDCMICGTYRHAITKQNSPCLSQLVADSLEACEFHVSGDITVDGQILNPCCQGSGTGNSGQTGPTGPSGAIGPMGPQGLAGTCLTESNYLFATYFSTGFIGTDGNVILTSSNYFEIPADQEVAIPLEINPSMTNGWSGSVGSSASFVVPETGVYKLSYEIYLILPLFTFNFPDILTIAWVERNSGSVIDQLFGSSAAFYPTYIFTPGIPALAHTFLADLNGNEEISLICTRQFGGSNSLIVASGFDSSVAASLVITRVS